MIKPFKRRVNGWVGWWPDSIVANGWQPYDQPHPDAYLPHEFKLFELVPLSGGVLLLQRQEKRFPVMHIGSISWATAERAHVCYALRGGMLSLERLAEDGGFGVSELAQFLGFGEGSEVDCIRMAIALAGDLKEGT